MLNPSQRANLPKFLLVAVLMLMAIWTDRVLYRDASTTASLDEVCAKHNKAKGGYRYGHTQYATQVVPAMAPAALGWNGTTTQKRILITGGAGFIG
jgi:hypothetical protein